MFQIKVSFPLVFVFLRSTEEDYLFVHFFHFIVFVSGNAENKMLFVTQFVFYLTVLFVPAENKGKVTHGKTPRVRFAY